MRLITDLVTSLETSGLRGHIYFPSHWTKFTALHRKAIFKEYWFQHRRSNIFVSFKIERPPCEDMMEWYLFGEFHLNVSSRSLSWNGIWPLIFQNLANFLFTSLLIAAIKGPYSALSTVICRADNEGYINAIYFHQVAWICGILINSFLRK